MTPRLTSLVVRAAATLVPPHARDRWRREWCGELGYGWQQFAVCPSMTGRWRLSARATGAVAHALWLRAQDVTMDHLLQDVRLAFRLLTRQPGTTLVAVLTLALGIGANTAVFSLVNTVLLKPIPVPGLDRLIVVREDLPGLNLLQADLAPAEVVDLSARHDIFAAVAGMRAGARTLTGFDAPMRVGTATTLGDFAGVFGILPHAGRFYPADQSRGGPHEVAVVSHGLWQQLSGGDPTFIGRPIELDGIPYEVIGVMPPGFRYPRDVSVWIPFAYTERWTTNRGSLFMATVARLGPGVGEAALGAGLAGETARWNEEYHAGSEGKRLTATGFVEHVAGPLRPILLVLLGAVLFVLLIAAANVASLQLVRVMGRSREIAVRSAIGASRSRMVRQFLVESLVLSAAGGLLGFGFGAGTLAMLGRWGPAVELRLTDIPIDGTVLAFTAGVTVLAAVLFGTLPALHGASVAPERVLRDAARGVSSGRAARRLLRAGAVVQIALALVLLVGAGLMVRTLSHLLSVDPGFQPAGLVTAQVSIPAARYDSAARAVGFFDEILLRVRAIPGVRSAALVFGLPFGGGRDSSPFDIPGRPVRSGEPARHAEAAIVSPGYFETMGIPIVAGRDFDGTERTGTPLVAVIDQTFAQQYFPGENPVGQRIVGYFGSETTIIGVAGRVDQNNIGDRPKAVAYYSYAHQSWHLTRTVVVRSDAAPGVVLAGLRTVVSDLDPQIPIYDVGTMTDRIERWMGPRRLALAALGGLSGLALLLSALGVYGVMRYSTRQRRREIGIRMALGARPQELVRLVVRQGIVVAFLGVVLGTAVALPATRLGAGMLFGVGAHDPATFGLAAAVLGVATVAASLLPAAGAARVDPVEAIRAY